MVSYVAVCVRHSARRRPKMSQVVRALEGYVSLSDLDEGIKPRYNSAYNGSSDYDTTQYNVVELRNRLAQIEIIENVHKRQKGEGEWRDSKEEKVAFDICENIKEKVVQVYDYMRLPMILANPLMIHLIYVHRLSSPPDDIETETGLEIKARIEAEVKSRVEAARLEMKEQIENQFKQIFKSLQNTMPCSKSIVLAEERNFTL
ncbi:hypothetical protein Tco_1162005 [Tanacetum coccineum]